MAGRSRGKSIIAADFNYKEMSRRDFTQALISEASAQEAGE